MMMMICKVRNMGVHTNQEITEQLPISPKTSKTSELHNKNIEIYTKI